MTARIAPAEVISIFGPQIGPATAVTAAPANGFYPTTLGGVQVMIGGIAAPLLYVSSSQINAVVPMGATSRAASTIQIVQGTNTLPSFSAWVDATALGIFPGLLNQDGTLNSQTNPAKAGSTVSLYVTGWQTSFAPLLDGQVATSANDLCSTVLAPCVASAGTITYGGTAPGIVAGVSQFNVRMDGPNLKSSTSVFIGPLNLSFIVWVQQ